jgi:hypothetical protein
MGSDLASAERGSNMNLERTDPIDLLFTEGQEKALNEVVELLQEFINQTLAGTGAKVNDMALQMHDGVYLILLIGTLANFFVPLNKFTIQPKGMEEKVRLVTP